LRQEQDDTPRDDTFSNKRPIKYRDLLFFCSTSKDTNSDNSPSSVSSVPSVGSALLPPLPRTSPLTQSVSLAPLSAHLNKKQQQSQLSASSSLSTAKSAFNLSQEFDRNLNLRRSKRFVRQIATGGSLGIQVRFLKANFHSLAIFT